MIILHGDNVVLSRKKLDEITSDFKGEVVRLEADQINLTNLKQATESISLFGQERLVVVENLFSRRPSQDKEAVLGYLKKAEIENLVIWEGKVIDGRNLTVFSKAKILKFILASVIFKLVDSLSPRNYRQSLILLHQCFKKDTPEMVSYMLARQIRMLLMAKDEESEALSSLPAWQQGKFLNQAKKFSDQKLLELHRQLLFIDWQQKTGRAPFSLASQLDLLVASV